MNPLPPSSSLAASRHPFGDGFRTGAAEGEAKLDTPRHWRKRKPTSPGSRLRDLTTLGTPPMEKRMKYSVIILVGAFLCVQSFADTYTFTDKSGRKLEAEVLVVNPETVVVRRVSDMRVFTLPFSNLEDADLQAMRNWGKPGLAPKAPDPQVEPGKNIAVAFPDLAPDRNGNPAVMNVRIPQNYDPNKPVPLFIFMGGGNGSNGASDGGLVDGTRFVTAGLPFPKGADNPNKSNMVGDFDEIWDNYHRPMLLKLFEMVPNLDRRLCILGGFSNGGNCIAGVLQSQKNGGYSEFFNCFILADGGVGSSTLRGPASGGYLFATWGENSPNANSTRSVAKKVKGLKVETYEMPGAGHTFNKDGKAAVKAWLDKVVIPATIGQN
jgi:hypothetical protein